MLEALSLPVFEDLRGFSNYIGVSETIIYLLTEKTSKYYRKFIIPKKNGGQREILAPSYSLKLVQKWILQEILNKLPISDVAFAYKKGNGLGIKKNAEMHKNGLYLLEMDFRDFFPSISRDKVFYLFRNIGYNTFISNILANLCTHENVLPQGGVCSPCLSNIVCYRLDKRLKSLCLKREIVYSRYADDLTFSCDNKLTLIRSYKLIEKIINQEDFKLNAQKTRYLSPSSHKVITGITVDNANLKAKKELKKFVRAAIFRSIVSKDYSQNDKIRGLISYIDSIEKGYTNKTIKYVNSLRIKSDFTNFADIVEEFNKNKLYKEVPNMVDQSKPIYEEDEEEFLADIVSYRMDYLRRNNLVPDPL